MTQIVVGSFPYRPGFNPYQKLVTGAIEEAGLTVVRIPPKKWFPLQKAFAVDCDILHLDWPHDWYQGRNGLTRFLKRAMYLQALRKKKDSIGKTKLVWTAHNLVAHDTHNRDFEHRMIQALIDQCDGIMVLSEASRQQLQQTYHVPKTTSVKTVYHGHYIDCYPNEIDRSISREQLNIGSEEQVFLSVGSIKPYKGHLELIKVFSEIATPNQRLILAGSARQPALNSLIQDATDKAVAASGCKIDLNLQLVQDDQLQTYFNAADVCVLPFRQILNSGSLLMAMSFGVPVIAPAAGSIPEVAFPEFRCLYNPEDSQGLRNSILEMKGRLCSVNRRGLHIAATRDKFSWTNVGQELKSWYSELMAK